jgi:hypothetical protein
MKPSGAAGPSPAIASSAADNSAPSLLPAISNAATPAAAIANFSAPRSVIRRLSALASPLRAELIMEAAMM